MDEYQLMKRLDGVIVYVPKEKVNGYLKIDWEIAYLFANEEEIIDEINYMIDNAKTEIDIRNIRDKELSLKKYLKDRGLNEKIINKIFETIDYRICSAQICKF